MPWDQLPRGLRTVAETLEQQLGRELREEDFDSLRQTGPYSFELVDPLRAELLARTEAVNRQRGRDQGLA
jgi:hypothetical protein